MDNKMMKNEPSACCGNSCKTAESESITTQNQMLEMNDQVITKFKVMNMDCADEIKAINDVLKNKDVYGIKANLMASTIEISHNRNIKDSFLKTKINSTVVKVVEESSPLNINKERIIKVSISGLLLLTGLTLEFFISNSMASVALFLFSIFIGGSLIFPKALSAIKRHSLDMNVLMTVAVMGALIIKQYSEATTVVFLFSLSELLESLSVQRARKAIEELFKITPKTALVVNGDRNIEVDVEKVSINQVVRVKAGENIPMDGVLISGQGNVNQASLTGESIPVYKTVSDEVFAGTLNIDGSFDIKVTKSFENSKLSHVVKLVAEAQSQRAPAQLFVDKFAQIYTPVVFVLAVLIFIVPLMLGGNSQEWFYKALVLLVIACPCALVISTPISVVSSLTALAKKGVLIKGGSHLEMLGKISTLALDKTGTITEGKPEVKNVEILNGISIEQFLEIAASIETHSNHPIAQAIIKFADDTNIKPKKAENFKNLPGKGIEATIDGHIYFLGNHKFVSDSNLTSASLESKLKELEKQSLSIVVIGHKPHSNCTGEILGIITIGDKIRENAQISIEKIKKAGVKKVVVLSGDNQTTTSTIASSIKADLALGGLLPEDKVEQIKKLLITKKHVAMVGDGVNDAPAMATASLGIAMGGIGTGVAIETADVTLMSDDLSQISTAIKAGRRTLHVIKFNIAFSILTKLVFLILALFGISNLWMAIVADTGATLIVILNSLRLLNIEE